MGSSFEFSRAIVGARESATRYVFKNSVTGEEKIFTRGTLPSELEHKVPKMYRTGE
jgi:hypothetical protein